MSGLDWVQVDVGFPLSLAVVGAARLLGMDRRAFLGAIVELQIWAVQALPSGRFEPFAASAGRPLDASADTSRDTSTDEAIWREAVEGAVRWTGAPGAFWDTLLRTGILVREGDSVRLTLCDRYVQVLEKRRKEAERKRRERANKAAAASGGRPADAPGTSAARRKRERENEKKTLSSAAAAMEIELGMSPGHLAPVPPPPPADEAPSVDGDPIQLSLHGTHLVPVSQPSVESEPEAPAAAVSPGQAEAFFERFQTERAQSFRGVPREDMPVVWKDWYRHALAKVGGDEGRLLSACRGYLQSDWGRSRQPAGTAVAFCSPKVWVRYVPHEANEAREVSEGASPPSVDVSTPAGRTWQQCLMRLHDQGKRYALLWLQKARPVDVQDGCLILAAPDVYFRQWVEENYGPVVEQLVRDCGLRGVTWRVGTGEELPQAAMGLPR
ncbi:DnaA N-terminal domain-containing protein [Pyxidicoccus xibeiensis]|uniref:DnaA N-terminal domain-containing protein n=1 Tax=Pyxidicoccus xibeiensis TaxID=2906759 RepID=UPI0020A80C25|nr:DnaA N-terminal domain-containing protein [Pyxidicoccus xibeiensis]MCP3138290.1 hypothetical protein [Pyxidicoccus xibeiensis]